MCLQPAKGLAFHLLKYKKWHPHSVCSVLFIAAGASDAMSIVADAYNMLTLAGGKTAATIPAFMRQNHPTRQSNLQQGAPGPAPAAPAGPFSSETAQQQRQQQQASQEQQQEQQASQEQQQEQQQEQELGAGQVAAGVAGFAAAGYAESARGTMSHVSSAEYMEEYLGYHRRTSSCHGQQAGATGPEAEAGPSTHHVASEPHEHWNPHGHLSSNEELSPQLPGTDGQCSGPGSSEAGLSASPAHRPGSTSSSSSRASTPDRPASGTPSHSRSSSTHSFAGFEAAGPGPAPGVGLGAAAGGAALGAGRAAGSSRPQPAQKIVVRVKYKAAATAGGAAGKK
jgi:hypothetical protein